MLAIKNWQTTLLGLSPLALYALQAMGLWPAWAPALPPLAATWPQIMAAAGIGIAAKDSNVTGGSRQQ